MSIKKNRPRFVAVVAALAVAFGFGALYQARQADQSDASRTTSMGPQPVASSPSPSTTQAPHQRASSAHRAPTEPAPGTRGPDVSAATPQAVPAQRESFTYDPRFHVYLPHEHGNHEYSDQDRFSTETLKVYANNGDALAAFFVGMRLSWSDREAGAQYLKLATMLSGKAGPLDVLAKKYSRGRIEDIEQAYLLGYAAAAIGFYEGYEEIVPKTERMLWRRYDVAAAADPDFSAEQAMGRLRARRAQIVRELNQSPLIQIDDSVDYPRINDFIQPAAQGGE